MSIDEKQVAMWASLNDDSLRRAVEGTMFGIPLFESVEANWNSMVEFFGKTSKLLYPDSVRNGHFGISARHDLRRIGVPVPQSSKAVSDASRIEMMHLGGNMVPFLTFGQEYLEELVGSAQAETAGRLAGWLFKEWGTAKPPFQSRESELARALIPRARTRAPSAALRSAAFSGSAALGREPGETMTVGAPHDAWTRK